MIRHFEELSSILVYLRSELILSFDGSHAVVRNVVAEFGIGTDFGIRIELVMNARLSIVGRL